MFLLGNRPVALVLYCKCFPWRQTPNCQTVKTGPPSKTTNDTGLSWPEHYGLMVRGTAIHSTAIHSTDINSTDIHVSMETLLRLSVFFTSEKQNRLLQWCVSTEVYSRSTLGWFQVHHWVFISGTYLFGHHETVDVHHLLQIFLWILWQSYRTSNSDGEETPGSSWRWNKKCLFLLKINPVLSWGLIHFPGAEPTVHQKHKHLRMFCCFITTSLTPDLNESYPLIHTQNLIQLKPFQRPQVSESRTSALHWSRNSPRNIQTGGIWTNSLSLSPSDPGPMGFQSRGVDGSVSEVCVCVCRSRSRGASLRRTWQPLTALFKLHHIKYY